MADQIPPNAIPMKNLGGQVPQMYTDGAAQIHVANDVAKIELFTQLPTGSDKLEPTITGRIIMPIQAYLGLFELMKDVTQKLIANGIIEEK